MLVMFTLVAGVAISNFVNQSNGVSVMAQVAPACDSGYTLTDDGTACVLIVTVPAECPEGYNLDLFTCVQSVPQQCPDNYTLEYDGWCLPDYLAEVEYTNCRIQNNSGNDTVFPVLPSVDCSSITSQIGQTATESEATNRTVEIEPFYVADGLGFLDRGLMDELIVEFDNSGAADDFPVFDTNYEPETHFAIDVCQHITDGNTLTFIKANRGNTPYNCQQNLGSNWSNLWSGSTPIRLASGGTVLSTCPDGFEQAFFGECQRTADRICPVDYVPFFEDCIFMDFREPNVDQPVDPITPGDSSEPNTGVQTPETNTQPEAQPLVAVTNAGGSQPENTSTETAAVSAVNVSSQTNQTRTLPRSGGSIVFIPFILLSILLVIVLADSFVNDSQ